MWCGGADFNIFQNLMCNLFLIEKYPRVRLKSKYYILKFIFYMVWEIVEDDISREDGLGGGLRV